MKLLCLLLVIFSSIFYATAQSLHTAKENRERSKKYASEYTTHLKGGYNVFLKANGDTEYLYLRKQSRIISELSSGERGMLFKNLGYIGADFANYFVLVHSFGSGNPHEIELISKKTGKSILKDGACWIGVVESDESLLYSEVDVPSSKDKMILYSLKSGKKQLLDFPADIFDEPQILNRIEILTLSNKLLVIRYEIHGNNKRKIYSL
jgi:hypothetical protein